MAGLARVEGHGKFSTQLEVNSFDTLEKKLTSEHTDWDKSHVRREALIIYNTHMLPRQVKTYFDEKAGKEEIHVDEVFDVVGRKLHNPYYGAFDKMIANAQTNEERAQLRLWQETMVNASPGTQVVSMDLSAIQRGGVRYADIARKTADGKVKIERRVDVGRAGLLSLPDSWSSLQQIARTGGRTIVTNGARNVGIVVVDASERADTNRLALEITASTNREQAKKKVELHISQQLPYDAITTVMVGVAKPIERTIKDTGNGIRAISGFIASEIQRRIEHKHQPETTKGKTGEREKKGKPSAEKIRGMVFPTKKIYEKFEESISEKKHRRRSGEAIFVSRRLVEKQKIKNIERKQNRNKKTETRSGIRIRRKERTRKIKAKERVKNKETKIKMRRLEPKKRFWRKEKGKKVTKKETKARRERKRTVKEAKKIDTILKRETTLWKIVRLLARQIERKKTKKESRRRKYYKFELKNARKEKKFRLNEKEKRQAVLWFSFAVMLWCILQIRPQEKNRKIKREIKNSHILIYEKHPTQWVLFAIIWYLGMIREQRMPVRPRKQKKARKKTLSFPRPMPVSGVIFAFAS